MAANKKPAEELVITNPHYNASHQLGFFDGMKVIESVDSKGNVSYKADRSDPKTMELIKKVQEYPRIPGCGDGGKSAPRIKVDDKEYTLSNKFFTDTEAENYKNYRDEHGKGGSGSSNRGQSIGDRKTFDMLTQMIDKYSKKKGDEYKEIVEDLKAQRKLYMTALSRDELMELLLAGDL